MISDYFLFGIQNMKHRQLRSWLTIIGVIIGIAAIVALITLGEGFENAIVEQFGVLGADRIRVAPEGLTGPPVSAVGLTIDDVDTVKRTRGVDFAGGLIFASAIAKFDDVEQVVFVKGIDSQLAANKQLDVNVELMEGTWFAPGEEDVGVIGYSLANNVYDKEIRLRQSIEIKGRKVKVVGILESIGDQSVDQIVYLPYSTAEGIFDAKDEVNAIFAAVNDGEDMNEVAKRIEVNLEKDRGDDNFVVFTPDEILNQLASILGVVQFVLAGIAAISLLVGGIGIMNSMYTAVLERTRQIGLMKAVGASPTTILQIFIFEAGLIGVVGGILGCIVGLFFAYSVQFTAAIAGFDYLSIQILWDVLLYSLGFSFVVGILSGTYPAYKASKLQPVEALRYE
jgi:putative ABC transport system permease protein